MNTSEQINSVINNITGKLGDAIKSLTGPATIASGKVYEVLMKQAFVDGILYGILCIVGLILILVSFIILIKFTKKNKDGVRGYDKVCAIDTDLTCIIIAIIIILFVMGCLFIGCNIGNCLTAFINPEYYTATKIIDLINSMSAAK